MKKLLSSSVPSPINSDPAEIVNRTPDPEWILALVDLIFLNQEEGRTVSS